MIDQSDYLAHYGILGMKWGVRRTPEQLGHRRSSDSYTRYKDKKIAKVDKLYKKAFAEAEKAMQIDPKNQRLKAQVKKLKSLYQSDVDKIKSMTYIDVQNEKRAIKQRKLQTAKNVAIGSTKAVAGASLWGLRMGLTGVRIYGTLKVATMAADMGAQAIHWLTTDEGAQTAMRIGGGIKSFVDAGDSWVNNNQGLLNTIGTADLSNPSGYLNLLGDLSKLK